MADLQVEGTAGPAPVTCPACAEQARTIALLRARLAFALVGLALSESHVKGYAALLRAREASERAKG